jgi:hypothetical protein
MEITDMRRFVLFGCCCVLFVLSGTALLGGTYSLTDGQIVTGDPISYTENGVVLRSPVDGILPRISWGRFTQRSLKQLRAEGRTPKDGAFIEPFITELVEEKAKRKVVKVRPVERIPLPAGRTGLFAAFSSPLGLVILGALYLANLYAALEIARYRLMPPALVCGLAAVFPVVIPIIFLILPTRTQEEIEAEQAEPGAATEPEPVSPLSPGPAPMGSPSSGARGGLKLAGGGQEPAPGAGTEPVVFQKGDFTFNRRFFETRMPGFFRVVPGDAEKDMVVMIKSLRGEYVGRRITRITPNELDLQTFKGDVTADVLIPFNEIQEVQIRHQDTVPS